MKQRHMMAGLGVPALLLTVSAYAHDPAEHMKDSKGQKPDCAAMENMDHSNMDMDMDDPVMQAMMQKCMGKMHGEQSQGEDDHSAHQRPDQEGQQEKPEHQSHQQHKE